MKIIDGNLTPILVEPGAPYDFYEPHVFYQTCKDLHLSVTFRERILEGASTEWLSIEEATIGYADVVASNESFEAAIAGIRPDDYVFEIDIFLALLATLIENQRRGEKGALLDNGQFNVFLVDVNGEVLTTIVFWNADDRKWMCHAWVRPFIWGFDVRFFSAAIE